MTTLASQTRSLAEQLDAEEAALALRMQELRRRRYGVAAVSRLPNELLTAIFREVAFIVFAEGWAGHGGPAKILGLAHVCSVWRRIAISSRIWYYLDLGRPRLARLFTSWSPTGPLRLVFRQSSEVGSGVSVNCGDSLWRENAGRVDALFLQSTPASVSRIFNSLSGIRRNIETLCISCSDFCTMSSSNSDISFPLLRRLRLEKILVQMAECQYLTHLTLGHLSPETVSPLLSLISSSKRLQKIYFYDIETGEIPVNPPNKLHLRSLMEFSMKDVYCLQEILATIIFPPTATIKIHFGDATVPSDLFSNTTDNPEFLSTITSARVDSCELICYNDLQRPLLSISTDRAGSGIILSQILCRISASGVGRIRALQSGIVPSLNCFPDLEDLSVGSLVWGSLPRELLKFRDDSLGSDGLPHLKRLRLIRMSFEHEDTMLQFSAYVEQMMLQGFPIRKLHLVSCSGVKPSFIERIRGKVWSLEIEDPVFKEKYQTAKADLDQLDI